MIATHFCPSCGFNLEKDEPLAVGDWNIDLRGGVQFRGRHVDYLSTTQIGILHTIAASRPRNVSIEILTARHSESESSVSIRVLICALKRDLRFQGIPVPIKTDRGAGYHWTGGAAR